MMKVYEPAEDSIILVEAVKAYAFGNVLDMGTGSGIQALAAAGKKEVKHVIAADINEEALRQARIEIAREKIKKIKAIKSDLFEKISGKFDTIIFNPPYLPQDKGIKDCALYGGKHGHETLIKFLDEAPRHLNDNGLVITVFSSLTGKEKIDEAIAKNCMKHELLAESKISFETLYVYRIKKSLLLTELGKKGIKGMTLFAKGNRGLIYRGTYKGKDIAIKVQRKDTFAAAAIENETKWLRQLNKIGVGPKLLFSGNDWFACEFIKGRFIIDYIISCNEKHKAGLIIRDLLGQCRKLDRLKINKEEMLRPQKHVIVNGRGKAVMLDFERCHKNAKPKNVTQFCQFLSSGLVVSLLKQKGIILERDKILEAAKNYKHRQTDENFRNIKIQID